MKRNLSVVFVLLLASSAHAEDYHFLWQFGVGGPYNNQSLPAPATLKFGFEDLDNLLPPITLTVPNIRHTMTWTGTGWTNDMGVKLLNITSGNAGSYGLDWGLLGDAVVGGEYERVFFSTGDLRYDKVHSFTNIVNYVPTKLDIQLEFYGSPAGVNLPPFINPYRAQLTISGRGDQGPPIPFIPEPASWLLFAVGLVVCCARKGRKS